jgi:hypothetical protein
MNVLLGFSAAVNVFVCCSGTDLDCSEGAEERVRGIFSMNWWFGEGSEAEWI